MRAVGWNELILNRLLNQPSCELRLMVCVLPLNFVQLIRIALNLKIRGKEILMGNVTITTDQI